MPFEKSKSRSRASWAVAQLFLGVGLVCLLLAGLVLPLTLGTSTLVSSANTAWLGVDDQIVEPELPGASVMLAADGTPIARFAEYDRQVVSGSQISENVKKALVATEDVRFYQHGGVDMMGLLRAVRSNAGSNATQGGSTITQQYVKNAALLNAELSGDPDQAAAATERSLTRKIGEAKKAIELEKKYGKDEIMAKYLNLVNFGAGAYGVEAAARRYYSTTAAALTIPQAATLVGVLNAPSALNPLANPAGALNRRNLVLDRMATAGYITAAQAREYKRQDLNLKPTALARGCAATRAVWSQYCNAVVRELLTGPLLGSTQAEREAVWRRGGLTIHTAMIPTVQAAARKAARAHVPPASRVTATAAVVKPGTGEVAALAMSKDFGTGVGLTELPLGTKAIVGPGSTMKLFTLATAVSKGMSLSTRFPGGTSYSSATLDNPASGSFHNYDTSYASNLTVEQAVARSVNTVMIQIEEKVGVLDIARMARAMGASAVPLQGAKAVTAKEGSFTLGAREIPVVQMADAYATVAADGLACPATLITGIDSPHGPLTVDKTCRQVLTPAASRAVTWALEGVVKNGTGHAAALKDRPVAGKTGTSQDVSSAWFAGYTPSWAMVVAVADPRGPKYPLVNVLGLSKVYGGTIPAAVFKQTMDTIHEGIRPQSMVTKLDSEYLLAQSPTEQVSVPHLSGLDVSQAAASLELSGLTATGSSSGVVTSTMPAAGSVVARGTRVVLVSSR